jgi:hypothetical protein
VDITRVVRSDLFASIVYTDALCPRGVLEFPCGRTHTHSVTYVYGCTCAALYGSNIGTVCVC